ncbi:Diphthine--ammonia ligase [Takifugu flavidus]|uniref:Diphthine--ammonia ligase n=1 Tax=Takifugu flavidus TaxID=433684 RepID=A0A5C6P1G8_9TELE|nr:Diphthine--ammonia ligase [Takifugu flavidus]
MADRSSLCSGREFAGLAELGPAIQYSGGKDSCYNMMQCVAAGHQIVALANLRPANTDELDSYMYQTVGHQAIDLYAEAMDLPLYRRIIQGSSLDTSKNYTKTDGDEVEDLYDLLHLVKESREKSEKMGGEEDEEEEEEEEGRWWQAGRRRDLLLNQ